MTGSPHPGRAVPSGWPDEYRDCQREAVAAAPGLLRALLDPARAALRSRLPGRPAPLRALDRFAGLLADGFQAQLARALQAPPPVPAAFAWPELPGADAAGARRYRAETEAADMQYAEFRMLWVAAAPLEAVGRQPLHPANYLAALRAAVELADVAPGTRRLWLLHLQSALPGRLAGVYLRLASGLEAAGVQPSSVDERLAAQAVVAESPVERPVDLASFAERFSQRFEHTLPADAHEATQAERHAAAPPRGESRIDGPDRRRPGDGLRHGGAGEAGAPSRRADGSAAGHPAGPAARRLPAPGAWLELGSAAVGAAPVAWGAWQVAWRGADGRLCLLRDAEGRHRSLTRAVFLRLQREGRLRFP